MSSTTMRVPDEVSGHIKAVASMLGRTPSGLIAEAWVEFFDRHKAEFAAEIEEAAAHIRDGNRDALLALAHRGADERAEAAMRAAGLMDAD